jgi:hypothetical protein
LGEAFRRRSREKLAVAESGEAVGEGFGKRAFVSDHDDGHAELGLQFAEKREDGFAGGGIEIARGFIGEKNFRAIDEGAGDGHALLFAAGEFGGAMAEAMREADTFKGFADARGTLGAIDFGEAKREFDIFLEGHARKEIEGLEDHADGGAAIAGEIEGRERGDIPAEGEDGAGGGAVESGDEIEEGGFAGAGGAEEGEEFILRDAEGDFVDGADGGCAHGVVTGDAVELDGGGGGGHGGCQSMIREVKRKDFMEVKEVEEVKEVKERKC